ncbi:nucleoside hydrolase-like domain-containing protein [Flexithrix dorotheae]|uniref:nucleoside hydrolase-like domain-containing protein n=1 Tax=Flexithrix dorotheae TaxID=70993 RepID=UPI00039A320E|nr:nucleoside hydrolase-like domain-containing protein [Flexithrix dorotheae]
MIKKIFIFTLIFLVSIICNAQKPSVFILTDINLVGGDPDDRQSLIHVLWYANELNIRGVVPDYWNGKSQEACQETIEIYAKDFVSYGFKKKGYPEPEQVEKLIAKDENDAIERLKNEAENSESPLYVLVWGQMITLKKALFTYPEISSKIRVLSIGTGLKYGPKDEVPGKDCTVSNWNGKGRDEIYKDPRFQQMWWLESNWTYNGMFMGEEPEQMFEQLQAYGKMGKHIKTVTKNHSWAHYFRVGDTPTVLYLIDPNHNPDLPEESSWAGKFKKPFPHSRPNYFTDDNGEIEWDYADPCKTWGNLKEMYAYNKSTLHSRRAEMYESLLEKLNSLYGK